MTDENTLLLSAALELGERILECGGSVNRVEKTINRICSGYGAERTDVFAITSSIVVSMVRGGETVTQTRRITGGTTDFSRLEALCALADRISRKQPPIPSLSAEIDRADNSTESIPVTIAGHVLAASAFALFFAGSVSDAVCSGAIAVLIWLMGRRLRGLLGNELLYMMAASFVSGIAALLCGRFGLCVHTDIVMIGDIMLLIPGIALTNALRDLFYGDTISGMLRLMEALMQATMIAAGFALAMVLGGLWR